MGRKTYEKPLGRTPEMTAGWKGNGRLLDLDAAAVESAAAVSMEARLGGYNALSGLI